MFLGQALGEIMAKLFVNPTILRVVRVARVGRVLRLVKGSFIFFFPEKRRKTLPFS